MKDPSMVVFAFAIGLLMFMGGSMVALYIAHSSIQHPENKGASLTKLGMAARYVLITIGILMGIVAFPALFIDSQNHAINGIIASMACFSTDRLIAIHAELRTLRKNQL
jgi:hypothetical protein